MKKINKWLRMLSFGAFLLGISFTVGLLFYQKLPVHAQTTVECGSIVDGEISKLDQGQDYLLTLAPGDSVTIKATTVGQYFHVFMTISAPSGGQPLNSDPLSLSSGAVSEPGIYTIHVGGETDDRFGLYTLYFSCVLRNGKTIKAGSLPKSTPTTQPVPTSQTTSSSAFSGIGFPGLPPVDFSKVAKLPLVVGTPMSGAVTPTGGEILGFTLDGKATDKLDLTFTRLSGNLNLGLVVLSSDNKVVYQASLVNTEMMEARFTLPTAGQYTIGVFRIDLLPPDNPKATAFTIEGKLNS